MTRGFLSPAWSALFTLLLLCFGSALAEPTTSLSVEVIGGAHAGRHDLASGDSYCTIGSGDKDSWYTLFGNDAPGPAGLSIFVLTIPHIATIGAGTSDFSVVAGFGAYGEEGYTEYTLEPAQANGAGTLTLLQAGRKRALVTAVPTADPLPRCTLGGATLGACLLAP
jgi:hypothetical protein